VSGLHQVPSNPEEIVDGTVDGEKALDVAQRLKPAHVAFPLACGLVGDFGAIIGILRGAVMDGRHTDSVGSPIAAEFIGD
jgi:hypothetical protein